MYDEQNVFTAQEAIILGGSIGEEAYGKEPHKPMAVISGYYSVEECEELRQEDPLAGCIAAPYFGKSFLTLEGEMISTPMTLEHLILDSDSPDYGKTVRDPQLHDFDRLRDIEPEEIDMRDEFPFKRE
jgi:hypothetical protein